MTLQKMLRLFSERKILSTKIDTRLSQEEQHGENQTILVISADVPLGKRQYIMLYCNS